MARCYSHEVEKAICDALGLKDVLKLDIHLEVKHIATLEVTRYITVDELTKLAPILQKFELRYKNDFKEKTNG